MCSHIACRLASVMNWMVPVMTQEDLRCSVNTLRTGTVICVHPDAPRTEEPRVVEFLAFGSGDTTGCKRCGKPSTDCWYVDCPKRKAPGNV